MRSRAGPLTMFYLALFLGVVAGTAFALPKSPGMANNNGLASVTTPQTLDAFAMFFGTTTQWDTQAQAVTTTTATPAELPSGIFFGWSGKLRLELAGWQSPPNQIGGALFMRSDSVGNAEGYIMKDLALIMRSSSIAWMWRPAGNMVAMPFGVVEPLVAIHIQMNRGSFADNDAPELGARAGNPLVARRAFDVIKPTNNTPRRIFFG